MNTVIIFKLLAALMLAFVWAAYLRKINLFGRIKWSQVLIALAIGGLTTLIVFMVNLPEFKDIDKQSLNVQRFAQFFYHVALMEEASKFAGFLVVIIIFQKWFREEPNYITYASLVALGFATVENFQKFYDHGISLVYMRGMMSTVSHIIYTSVVAGFMVVGLRKNIATAALYTFLGFVVSILMHGIFDFFISQGKIYFLVLTLIIFTIEIEIWARMLNNFLNFSRRINLKRSIDRNTLQKFLLVSFMTAGTIQLIGLLTELGWQEGIIEHLNLLGQELIITLILIIRITRFTIVPHYWKKIYPVLPISIRRGKFQRSIFPTSPRFFLKIKGDEFNEYPFTSRIEKEVKLGTLPQKGIDFDLDVSVKMLEKKFIGPKKDLYYLCEILDFHTIHPQYNSRYVLIRPKNYGKTYYKRTPIVGLIALKGFIDLNNIGPKDCKFINWMVMKKEGEKNPSQRMLDMVR